VGLFGKLFGREGHRREEAGPRAGTVSFYRTQESGGNHYTVYRADGRSEALAFLRGQEVKEERAYLVVETPEGVLGRDLLSIYDEKSGEAIELAERLPLPTPIRSATRCSSCGYVVLPVNPNFSDWVQIVPLEDLREKGLGFRCPACEVLWCGRCVPLEEGWPVCGFCRGTPRVFVENDPFVEPRVVVRPPPFQEDAVARDLAEAFRKAGEEGDRALRTGAVETALSAWRLVLSHRELSAAPAPFRLESLNRAAVLFLHRFRREGRMEDVDQAISLLKRGAESGVERWHGAHELFNNMAISFQDRYEKSSDGGDLLAAAGALEKAIGLVPSGSGLLSVYTMNVIGLADQLRSLFQKTGRMEALEAGVRLLRYAIDRGPGDLEKKVTALGTLSDLLRAVYYETRDLSALEASIEEARRALDSSGGEARPRIRSLNSLANALRARYGHRGDPGDIAHALDALRQASDLARKVSPGLACASLINLSTSFHERFQRTGNLDDLEAARQSAQEGVDLKPEDPLDEAAAWSAVGVPLHDRYFFTEDLEDLNAAYRAFRSAVELMPETAPELPGYLNNLGSVLRNRYGQSEEWKDIEAAAEAYRRGLRLSHPGSLEQPALLNNLGEVLREQFRLKGDPAILAEAVEVLRKSVELTPAGSPDLPGFLNNLAVALSDRHRLSSDVQDLEEGRSTFRRSCQLGLSMALRRALVASGSWASWALERNAWEEVSEALGYGLQAADLLFESQALRSQRESWLRQAQWQSALAAYARFQLGDLKAAVEVLEQGRTRLIAQTLELRRRDLERLLTMGREELYWRYRRAAERLSQLDGAQPQQGHGPREDLRAAREDLRAAIEEVRQVPGYANFFRPVSLEGIQGCLRARAPGQPDILALVYLTVTAAGGAALIVHSGGIRPLKLDLTQKELGEWLVERSQRPAAGSYLQGQLGKAPLQEALDELLDRLGERVVGPLAGELDQIHRERSGAADEVVLIPTGLLALAPLHACGYFRDGERRSLLDDFTVSYAPSSRLLGNCREALDLLPQSPPSLLAVGNPLPLPPHFQSLAFARAEAEQVSTLFAERAALLLEEQATSEAVEAGMNGARYLHFACHGVFELNRALDSGLVLSNGERVTTRDLLARDSRGSARLAVLSACQTALFEFGELPEESQGLPAAFLQAGVPGVIGSLWPVNDLSTALLIVRFYELHLQGDRASGSGPVWPARALRNAQIWLRDLRTSDLGALLDCHLRAVPDPLTRGYGLIGEELRQLATGDPSEHPFAHPSYWAPFVLYGL
jgi:CHAT domain-containing protein/tetratricopeptide (TPR) repeat protein